jgi:ubiquitin-like 1-activating enzyme E1 A
MNAAKRTSRRIRTAKILLIQIKALGTEVAKNLVLAGIGSLTIVDTDVVTEEDLAAQFFLSQVDVGKNVGRSMEIESTAVTDNISTAC